MQPATRYLEGSAYIVYGPGPEAAAAAEAMSPEAKTHERNDRQTEDVAFRHHCLHNYHHQQDYEQGHVDRETQAHFWAVFHANVDRTIRAPYHQEALTVESAKETASSSSPSLFVLRGFPHPWGCYPPELPEPHGCLPPHLYYRVVLSEHKYHDPSETPSAESEEAICKGDRAGRQEIDQTDVDGSFREWILPYVHRLGDGKDDAGGLTTAYSLLEDQESADDFGDFIEEALQQLPSEEYNASPSSSSSFSSTTEDRSRNLCLYASTDILVSEMRTMDVIKDNFFTPRKTETNKREEQPKALQDLRKHIAQVKSTLDPSQSLPFSLVKADLKLLLPMAATNQNMSMNL
ncbi:hypothetical protein BGX34_000997 [Mortierella sp. NVP85]|nr:hypothetical protein BGX34_000997 [Mortierella sp. NVP85]